MTTPTTPDEEIKPTIDDLIIFVDDTGHEMFTGNQEYYGLGGCIVTGLSYELSVKPKWRDVRRAINGNHDSPLHGSDITMNTKPETFAALRAFFELPSFVRFAVTTTKNVSLPANMHPCVPVMGQITKTITEFAALIPCKRLFIIIESSKRADPIVRRCFNELTSIDAKLALPTEHIFMPKSANQPGLEVADFIISAASSEVRRRLRGQSDHARDFNDVFCRIPPIGRRYLELTHVKQHPDGLVSVEGVTLT